MSEKQPQAIRDALDVDKLVEALAGWLRAYVEEHPDVSLASIQMGLRMASSEFALYGILTSPAPMDRKA